MMIYPFISMGIFFPGKIVGGTDPGFIGFRR